MSPRLRTALVRAWRGFREKSVVASLAIGYAVWGLVNVVGAPLSFAVRSLPYGEVWELAVWLLLVSVGGTVVSVLQFILTFPARWGQRPRADRSTALALASVTTWYVLLQIPGFFEPPLRPAVFALCLALGNASNYAYSLLFGSISHRSQIAASLLNAMLAPLAFALTLAGLPALNTWSLVTVLAGLEYLGIAYYLHSRLLKASSLGGWS